MEKELFKIYQNIKNGICLKDDLLPIKDALLLISKKIKFDVIDYEELIEILTNFYKLGLISQINSESISLLIKICLGYDGIINIDNTAYFNQYLKNMFLPSKLNHCDYEYNLEKFLSEYDIFFDLIRNNLDDNDLEILKKYNVDLYEIVKRYFNCFNEYQESDLFKYSSTQEHIIMLTILDHLGVILYLYIDEYDKKYDLFNETFYKIIDKYLDFLYECNEQDLFKDLFNTNVDSKSINEFLMVKKLLDYEFCPPISKKYIK